MSADEDLPAAAGLHDILPQYEVLDFLGRGGMGAVYKVRQRSLDRVVALKLLSVHPLNGGLDFAARFKIEAQAMARLNHPNIVAVHDFGETGDGRLFYVMEYVEGEDLARRLSFREKPGLDEIRHVVLSVIDALACAHSQGVIHRDIKPSNILLSRDGRIRVADFGLAKIDDPATGPLTFTGTSMGSQGYAAPEVFAKARNADHRADIYSLGVVLYELLTGDVPRGMFKLPSEKVPGLDAGWDAIICKAMEESVEDRYQTVAEFRCAIEALSALPVPCAADSERLIRMGRAPAFRRLLSTVAMLTLGVAGLWWMRLSTAPDQPASGSPEAAPVSRASEAPPPVITIGGHRYQLVPGSFIWTEANANAISMGGHLATLTSEQENQVVWSAFSHYLPATDSRHLINRGWWIGGTRGEAPDSWQWVTGEPFEYTCWAVDEPRAGRAPRLRQHDNGGNGGLSAWSAVHYNTRCGFLVEWEPPDQASSSNPPSSKDQELRSFAAWLLSLPLSNEPNHVEHKVPDLVIEGFSRNVRKLAELPAGPFEIIRVRIGPLEMNETAHEQLKILPKLGRLYDLRMYAVSDASIMPHLAPLTRLGTLIVKADPTKSPPPMTDDQLQSLANFNLLKSLRIEGWSALTGSGLAHLAQKRKLESLTLTACPALDDNGLAEIAGFSKLVTLAIQDGGGITDGGIARLRVLKALTSLGVDSSPDSRLSATSLKSLAENPQLRTLTLGSGVPGRWFEGVAALTQLNRLQCSRNSNVKDQHLVLLKTLTRLRVLRLDDTDITGTGFADFKGFDELEELNIEDCPISDEGLRLAIQAFPNLKSLTISRNHPTFATAVMAATLRNAARLSRLNLRYRFGDADMPLIARLTGLSSLNLEGSDVTDAGIAALTPLTGLTELRFPGLKLTDACVPALQELRQLKVLDVSGTALSPKGIKALQTALPACQIIP